ncbi:MAG: transglycosylase domain-containing protein [Ginsengibacter sp.]
MQNKKIIKNKNHLPGKSQMKSSVKILWITIAGGLGLFILILLFATLGVFGKLPSLEELENPQASLASEIYADDGKTLMGKIYTENRSPVDFKDISTNVTDALIATEDVRFYDHAGIDAIAIGRALKGLGSEGGGSTLTQQLAKQILHQGGGWFGKRVLDKMKEWIVALKLERNFTKQEILSLYLNRVPWGNIFGIRNASRVYFQKEPALLSVDEAALLVGMLSGPGKYDPVRHPDLAMERRNLVLNRMVTNKALTSSEEERLSKKPLGIKFKKLDENMGIAPYFRLVLSKKMEQWCKTHTDVKLGRNYDLYKDGLKIYTTINPKMQLYAEEAVITHMSAMQKKLNSQLGKNIWKKHQDILDRAMKNSERWKQMKEDGVKEDDIIKSFYQPVRMKIFAWNATREKDTTMTPMDSIKYLKQMMQTSFAAMDPMTGEVKAWVGGVDFKWFKYDHVTANRQVGSTFKPILYTLAILDAGLTPDSYIGGRTITLNDKTISGKGGTMAYCLAKSLNSGAYDLMSRIGAKKTAEFAHSCGITSSIPVVPSIALGSADLTLIEMLRAYTMFPNRGFNTEPVIISRIEDKNGNVLESFQPENKQIISEADAYTMYKMMEGVMDFGTGHSMRGRFGINSAMGGKTGTTNDNTDGWFIGYTPQILAGAWVGCDDPFLKIRWTYGGNEMAMPEWAYFMQKVYADKKLGIDPKAEFQKPAELDNNPIYADKNFSDIIKKGEGSDFNEDEGNGNAGDYEGRELSSPVESEFGKQNEATKPAKEEYKDIMQPAENIDGNNTTEKNNTPSVTSPKPADDKIKKPVLKPVKPDTKTDNEY